MRKPRHEPPGPTRDETMPDPILLQDRCAPRGRTAIHALFLALLLALAGCAPLPQRAGIPAEWRPSPNFDARKPNFVVLHHTGSGSAAHALRTLTDPLRRVSAHYLIGRDGSIIQLVDERARAWHAGASKWGQDTDLNSISLGIELDNNGDEAFPEAQISALLRLLADIRERYRIPTANFLGHADVAPGRKVDPSRHFPWKTLAEHGFGLWCDPAIAEPAQSFDEALQLRALGYDTDDIAAAERAFKLHFLPQQDYPGLDEHGRALLDCLYRKSAG
jgi:N-acetylmuramoyl-L-alanine amidase